MYINDYKRDVKLKWQIQYIWKYTSETKKSAIVATKPL